MRVYIAGPMTGIPDYNFPAFFDAEDWIKSQGHIAVNPARRDVEAGRVAHVDGRYETTDEFDRYVVLREDLRSVTICDAILLLPGWEESEGARVELAAARACGLEVWEHEPDEEWGFATTRPLGAPARLIGLSGYARAGKDTAADGLEEVGFTRVAFADALKDVAADVFETDREIIDSAKNQPGSPMRGFLQRLGVAVREHVSGDAWVRAALEKVWGQTSVVITDVRFPNEARAIKALGGEVWRVRRPNHGPANGHISEVALDDWPFDEWLYNDGTIIDLHWLAISTAKTKELERV